MISSSFERREVRAAFVLLLAFGTWGCPSEPGYLNSVMDDWGQEVAVGAAPAVRLSLEMGTLAAHYCGLTYQDWSAASGKGLELPKDMASWVGASSAGTVALDKDLGQYSVAFSGASIYGTEARVEVMAVTPNESIQVRIVPENAKGDTGESDETALATVTFRTQNCLGDTHQIQGSVSFHITQMAGETVDLPNTEGTTEFLVFPEGALLPSEGQVEWNGQGDMGRAILLTDDASALSDLTWPSTASGAGWTSHTDMNLDIDFAE
jgi:hypothetical protein